MSVSGIVASERSVVIGSAFPKDPMTHRALDQVLRHCCNGPMDLGEAAF
jgi:hypothetical protein